MIRTMSVFLFILAAPILVWGAETTPAATATINPHLSGASCAVCHEASMDDLNSFFTFPSTKRKLRGGVNGLCEGCHKRDFGHGVGQAPPQNKRGLPLDGENKIACAITCHNMHLKNPKTKMQERYHLRLPDDDLCLSCHEK